MKYSNHILPGRLIFTLYQRFIFASSFRSKINKFENCTGRATNPVVKGTQKPVNRRIYRLLLLFKYQIISNYFKQKVRHSVRQKVRVYLTHIFRRKKMDVN